MSHDLEDGVPDLPSLWMTYPQQRAATIVTRVLALAVVTVGAAAGLWPGPAHAQLALPADLPIVSPRYGSPPAPSAITTRLLAIALPTLDELERSSRLAATRGPQRLRIAAIRAAARDAATLDALAAASASAPIGSDPLDAAAAVAAQIGWDADAILAGLPDWLRTSGSRAVAADAAIAEEADRDLAQLAVLEGQAFEALYVERQREGLQRLLRLSRDYVQNGDDPGLRAIAVRALPRLTARIASLARS